MKLQKLLWRRTPDRADWRQSVVGGACKAITGSPNASPCRSRPRTAAPTCSMPCIPALPAISASAPIRSCSPRQGGRPRRPGRRPIGRDAGAGLFAARHSGRRTILVHVHPVPRSLAGCTGRTSPSTRPRPPCRHGGEPAAAGRDPVADDTAVAHADYLDWSGTPTRFRGGQSRRDHGVAARPTCPVDAMICNGAGNFAIWIHRFFRFRRYGTQYAPTSGSMATACRRPSRSSASIPTGRRRGRRRRRFLMTGQSCDRGPVRPADHRDRRRQWPLRTIRMHQEREYPCRTSATDLRNPDFVAYAQASAVSALVSSVRRDFPPPSSLRRQSGKAGDHPHQGRSRSDHAADDARQHPRQGAGRAGGFMTALLCRVNPGSLFIAFLLLIPSCRWPNRRTERVMQRLAARQDAILLAARAIAAESGMGAVQIAPVAGRAGIAAGTVYRYFPAKSDLVCAWMAAVSEYEIAACDAPLTLRQDLCRRWRRRCSPSECGRYVTRLRGRSSPSRSMRRSMPSASPIAVR